MAYRFTKREKNIAGSLGLSPAALVALGRLNASSHAGVRMTPAVASALRRAAHVDEAGGITDAGRDVVAKAIQLGW